jgi:hypothetical protein
MRFLADENFNGKLLAGLRAVLLRSTWCASRIQTWLRRQARELHVWAAEHDRILLTHDVQSIAGYGYARVRDGLPMPGIIEVRISAGIGTIVDELALMIEASTPDEFENQVRYIPIR